MAEPRLITIPISHYCEKARWALERAGIAYEEERHLQVFHHFYARKAGGGFTTPVLRLPNGEVLGQSSEIVHWVDDQLEPQEKLYPSEIASRVRAVEHWLDVTLGPDGRAWMYSHLLGASEVIENYGLDGIPDFERRFYKALFKGFRPYLAARVRLQGTDPDERAVQDVFDEIGGRLEDGRRYLFGDRFTAADMAFAALSAAVVLPRGYGVELPPIEALPPLMRSSVEAFREHPAGQFALRMFAEERRRVVGVAVPAASA